MKTQPGIAGSGFGDVGSKAPVAMKTANWSKPSGRAWGGWAAASKATIASRQIPTSEDSAERLCVRMDSMSALSVNELIPGPVNTAMMPRAAAREPGTFDGEWFKEPEEVVPLALFLASAPDGGQTAQSFSLMRRDG